MRILTSLLPAILGTLVSGCIFQTKEERLAGGAEDFPNTIALGAALSGNISEHANWDQFSILPATLPSLVSADSLVIAPGGIALGASLNRLAAGSPMMPPSPDSVNWDFTDTASLKVVRRIQVMDGLLKIHRDTSVFRYDAQFQDSIIGNELMLESKGADLWRVSGRVQGYWYQNIDSAGGFDRATFLDRLGILGSGFKNKILVMLPGPDGDINTRLDNRPAYYGVTLIRNAASTPVDTVESFQILDADGDGSLWGEGDSGVVDFQQKIPNPIFRPSVERMTQKMRAMLFKAEMKTYPISFSEIRVEKDGKQVEFSVKGTRSDSVCLPGDTAWISIHTLYPKESYLREKHSRYRVLLGSQPKQYQDNRLLRYSLDVAWRNDSLANLHFSFTPDAPVPSQELTITGTLSFSAELANGDKVAGTGRFENRKISVDLTLEEKDGATRHFHTQWNALGKLISQTPFK